MATSLALPASTGVNPQNAPAEVPKQPAAPALPKPATPAAPPLALAGSMGGQSSAQQSAVPIPQTADPLAFSPAPSIAAPSAPTLNAPPIAPSAAPAPATSPLHQYNSLEGLSEAERNAFQAKQFEDAGMKGVIGGGTTGLRGNAQTGIVDPATAAAHQTSLASDPNIADIVRRASGGGAADLASRNAASNATNLTQANTDADANIASIKGSSGVFQSPADEAAFRERLMRESGFGADNSFLGAPDNNPTATAGLPSNYKPSTLPNNGAVDGGGNYVLPGEPAVFGQKSPTPGDPVSAITQQATGGNNVALSEIDPENSLISKQITPGQNIDRVKTFQDATNSTIKNVIDPAYETSARNLNRYNFGAGRGVSGEARTSQGDLANDRERRIADLSAQGIADATRGSIDDNYRNIDETQQERDYQTGRADTAFDQDAQLALLRESLTNGAFGRADRQQSAGYANSPEDIGLILSKIFGDQSSEAGRAAAESFRNAGSGGGSSDAQRATGGEAGQQMLKWILDNITRTGNPTGTTTTVNSGETPGYPGDV